MDMALIDLVVFRVREKYLKESDFYRQINLTTQEWEEWKRGHLTLDKGKIAAIIRLFSDYEWMLVQKVLRQTEVIPEKSNAALLEYQKMSVNIATKWLKSDLATVELVEKLQDEQTLKKTIEVRVMMNYDSWGYGDILSFTIPAIERDKVAGSKRVLIQLIDETYNEKSELCRDETLS